jgi:hypothetical protein
MKIFLWYFNFQVGLNETPLTKALIAGHFGLAERLILENTDVDYLNDGNISSKQTKKSYSNCFLIYISFYIELSKFSL